LTERPGRRKTGADRGWLQKEIDTDPVFHFSAQKDLPILISVLFDFRNFT
jgi:hypothetical protein